MSGFFGCVSKRDCVADVFYGTDYHSHLGTKRGGLAFYDGQMFLRSIHSLEGAYFRNKFEEELPKFEGSCVGIGVISDTESQPMTLTTHLGQYSVVTIGRIDNIEELAKEMLEKRINFAELSGSKINATEMIAILISMGGSFKEGIEMVQRKVKGSCSFLILTKDGIYASRDKFGRTPIIIGKSEDGYVACTESSSFANLGYKLHCEVKQAQSFFISNDKITEITPAGKRKQVCSFLWVYYGYPSSTYEGINVEMARYRCGAELAKRDVDFHDADFAAGIPDSGIGHALGYSAEKNMPYIRAIVKYTPTWPRSFMPHNQKMRDLVAKMKLIPNESIIKGASMVLFDDSIVRGTQLKDNIVKLVEAGAKGLHIRIACPPLIFPCTFINFSTSRSTFDLFTRRVIRDIECSEEVSDEVYAQYADHTTERYAVLIDVMCKAIGSDTLKFQHLKDLVKAIGLPKEELCTHCWDNSSYCE